MSIFFTAIIVTTTGLRRARKVLSFAPRPTYCARDADVASIWVGVIVAAGGCVAIRAMFALRVFFVPIAVATGWSRTGLSSATAIGFLSMAGWQRWLGRIFGSLRLRPRR